MTWLTGKKVLIIGVAGQRSIAYGIAQACQQWGAELALTYQNEKLKSRVAAIAETLNCSILQPCDVTEDQQIRDLFESLSQVWPKFDILIHSVAFAPAEQLDGDYLDCINREGFLLSHEISSYSFAALAKYARPMLNERGALLTLSYLGAERVIPNYNVMGVAKASLEANIRYMAYSLGEKKIRVNGISAGPIRTLAASGIKNFKQMLAIHEQTNPLHENTTIEQVGHTAAFLCSDFASGITGEIIHVDSGFHTMGMIAPIANTSGA